MFWLDGWEFCRKRNCRDREVTVAIQDRFSPRQWLQRFGGDAARMLVLRRLLVEESGAGELSRMSDQLVIEQIAGLLASGRLHLHRLAMPVASGGQSQDSDDAEKLVPFPLSERRPRAPGASSREPSLDSPTFSPNINPAAQAAALMAAADQGKAFCPE